LQLSIWLEIGICLEKIGNWQSEIGNFNIYVTVGTEEVSIDSESSPGSIKNT